jgi:hypothetical protein
MLYKVTDIQFDFITDDDELSPEDQLEIINETCDGIWDAEDGDDLLEEITNHYGWCIKSIDYVVFSESH